MGRPIPMTDGNLWSTSVLLPADVRECRFLLFLPPSNGVIMKVADKVVMARNVVPGMGNCRYKYVLEVPDMEGWMSLWEDG